MSIAKAVIERERGVVISLVRINNRIIMRKDTGLGSKSELGYTLLIREEGVLNDHQEQETFGAKWNKQTCGETQRSILQLLLLIKCHLCERTRLKVTLLSRIIKKQKQHVTRIESFDRRWLFKTCYLNVELNKRVQMLYLNSLWIVITHEKQHIALFISIK